MQRSRWEGVWSALLALLLSGLGICAAGAWLQPTGGARALWPLAASPPGAVAQPAAQDASDASPPTVRLPAAVRRGVTLAVYGEHVLAEERTLAMLEEMWRAGVRWVAIVPTWYQASVDATTMARKLAVTPTDEALRTYIRRAHHRGLRVFLKPHVDVETGEWRGWISPRDRAAWFASYTVMLTHYARLAQDEGVAALALGVEFKTLEEETVRWQHLIREVRAVYRGLLTYAANHDSYQDVQFWDAVDWIGIDGYFSLATNNTPTVETMLAHWRTHLRSLHTWRQHRGLTAHPVVFTEVGYVSADGTARRPWWYPASCDAAQVDMAEQRDAYEALFRAVKDSALIEGVFLWWWDNPSTSDSWPDGLQWRCFFTPRGKPAFTVLQDAYR